MASTLLVGFAVSASPALAQTAGTQAAPAADVQVEDAATRACAANPTSPDCTPGGQAIVVTGSRIASPTVSAPSPLQVIDQRDIQDSGRTNLAAVLLENPTVSTPTFSRTNTAFSTSGAGIASIDLRNLGTQRTLVLINGHRTVAGVANSNIVDFNTIPAAFVERVDVLTGGASSLYGSDAMAGVINLIYRRNMQGIRMYGQGLVTEQGDGGSYSLGMAMGTNFADGRGNIMVDAEYTRENGISSGSRRRTFLDQNACFQVATSAGGCATAVGNGDNTDLFTPYAPFLSGFSPNTTVTFGPGAQIVRVVGAGGALQFVDTNGLVHNNDGTLAAANAADAAASGRRTCSLADPCHPTVANATGFNRSAYRTIAVPVERYLVALRGNYELADGISAYLEGNFSRSTVTTLIEPFAFQTAGVNGTAPNPCIAGTPQTICNGFHPIETRLGNGTIVRNPFVPDAIYNVAIDRTGDGLRDISFTRRLTDFGPRTYTARRTSFRLLTGLEGEIFHRFRYDAFFGYGQTIESQVGSGQVNLNNFTSALEAIPSGNGPICANPVARAQGCVPVNIFAGANQGFSPAAINYIQAAQTRNIDVQQTIAGASITGDLFRLWDGPVGIAAGVEYRKEFSASTNDPLTIAGLNGGNALAPTRGQFDVKEAFAEIAIPLLADRPFFNNLTLRAAGRVSQYSLAAVGTVYTWNVGAEYSPIRDIRFRAVLARAVRAPNIGELFGGRSQTFPTGLTDPCVGVTATSTTPASAQCRADPGVAANIATNGAFTVNQADIQGISGFNQGNPNLTAETGKTYTVGVVINPTSVHALRNLVLTVDYFHIRINDLIGIYPRAGTINSCYIDRDPFFCGLITRRAGPEGPNSAGSLQFINAPSANTGDFLTSGVDITVSYRQRLSDWGLGAGTLSTRLSYTRLIQYRTPGAGNVNNAGEEGTPWDRASGSVNYDEAGWGLSLRGNFIGRSYLPATFTGVEAGADGSQDYRIAPYFTVDAQVRFAPSDQYEFYVGIINAFNHSVPPIISGLPGDDTGTETDAGTYDPIGRRFYAGVRLKF
jgi:outer membrane receptor protein involved in Fe transport